MLYQLFIAFRDDLRGGPLEFLRVVTFPEFAALLAALVAFGIVTLSGNRMIRWLLRRKIGDAADFDDEQLNEASKNKKNTPTMGGLLVVGAIVAATVLVADIANFYVQMAVVCLLWLGGVGAVDDWLKLNAARRQTGRQGLLSREKLLLQIGLAAVLAMFLWRYAGQLDAASQLYVPFFKNVAIPLSAWVFVPLTVVVIVGSSNAVNLTDGLDGLAAGCVVMVALVLLVLSLIIGDARLSDFLLFHHLPQVAPLAVVCGATVGSALGFLWFNCNPARVFMGDTGSLALGGILAFVAVSIRQELLLVIAGGIFVAEAISVMLQVGWFKYTRKRFGEGRRIFLMSPLHHHFQKKGWTETQTVVRFWLVGAMLAIASLATIKLR